MYIVSRSIIVEKFEGKIVLFDPDKLLFYHLNETASFIFNLIRKNKSLNEIIDHATSHYEIDSDRIKKDVIRITEDLIKKKLITQKK